MFNENFKVGDKVKCLNNIESIGGYREWNTKNKTGTIVVKENGEYGINFDENIDGNSLKDKKGINHCEDGFGLWVGIYSISKLNQEEYWEMQKEKLYEEFYNRVIKDLKEKGLVSKELFNII